MAHLTAFKTRMGVKSYSQRERCTLNDSEHIPGSIPTSQGATSAVTALDTGEKVTPARRGTEGGTNV